MNLYKNIPFFFKKTLPFVLILLSFFIPISYKISIYLLDIAIVVWLVSDGWYKRLANVYINKVIIFTILFWCITAISLIYSDNIEVGFKKVSLSISLLLIPFIVSTQWGEICKYRKYMLNAFLIGLILIGLYIIIRAFYFSTFGSSIEYQKQIGFLPGSGQSYFFYLIFCYPFHPTYLAMYFNLGIALVAFKIKYSKNIWHRLLGFLVEIFFVTLIFLASSKAGYLTCIVVSVISLLWLLRHKSRQYVSLMLIFLIIGFGVLVSKNNRFSSFIFLLDKLNVANSNSNVTVDDIINSDDAVRLKIWQTIPSVVGKNWLFGLGIGDVRETLAKAYQEKNMDFALNKRFNAHNQYLETYVGLGLIGLSCLLLILGSALWQSIRRRDMVFSLFMLIILINFMFESVLERFFGVLFFVFFLSIFSMREVDSV